MDARVPSTRRKALRCCVSSENLFVCLRKRLAGCHQLSLGAFAPDGQPHFRWPTGRATQHVYRCKPLLASFVPHGLTLGNGGNPAMSAIGPVDAVLYPDILGAHPRESDLPRCELTQQLKFKTTFPLCGASSLISSRNSVATFDHENFGEYDKTSWPSILRLRGAVRCED